MRIKNVQIETLFFVSSEEDAAMLLDESDIRSSASQIVALSTSARLALDKAGLSYSSERNIAFSINKHVLSRRAKKYAYQFLKKRFSSLKTCNNFDTYLALEFQELYLYMYEIFQSEYVIEEVLTKYNPAAVVVSSRPRAYSLPLNIMLSGDNFLDREVLQYSASISGVKCRGYIAEKYRSKRFSVKSNIQSIKNILRPFRDNLIGMSSYSARVLSRSKNYDGRKSKATAIRSLPPESKRILFFVWADVYDKDYMSAVVKQKKEGHYPVVVAIGGKFSPENKNLMLQQNIEFYDSFYFFTPKIILHRQIIKIKYWLLIFSLRKKLSAVRAGAKGGMHFVFIYRRCRGVLKKLLVSSHQNHGIAAEIKKVFEPDIVINIFSLHGAEIAFSLPFEQSGIPVVGMFHGICGDWDLWRETSSPRYMLVDSLRSKEALAELHLFEEQNVHVVGLGRFAEKVRTTNRTEIRHKFGGEYNFVVIFCESSVFSHHVCFRYSTYEVMNLCAALAKNNPEIFFVYRVHHGADCDSVANFFGDQRLNNITVSFSPDPAFMELVQVADLVLSYHSSAVAESIFCDRPVILLGQFAITESVYDDCEGILKVDSFGALQGTLRAFVTSSTDRGDALKKSREFVASMKSEGGDDFGLKVAGAIEQTMKTHEGVDVSPLFDWHERVKKVVDLSAKSGAHKFFS